MSSGRNDELEEKISAIRRWIKDESRSVICPRQLSHILGFDASQALKTMVGSFEIDEVMAAEHDGVLLAGTFPSPLEAPDQFIGRFGEELGIEDVDYVTVYKVRR